MKAEASSIEGLELFAQGSTEFSDSLRTLLGREPGEVLKPALPYSVIVRNSSERSVGLLGVRFDMVGRKGKAYSVVHYADTLRYPEKADLTPGAARFVCAEPLYTDLVLRRGREVDVRGRMNLDNLRTVLGIRASIDCAAFTDGEFEGRDSLGAFVRLEAEREAELALVGELEQRGCDIEKVLRDAMEAASAQTRDYGLLARRTLARRLHEGFAVGGRDEMLRRAHSHPARMRLWKTA